METPLKYRGAQASPALKKRMESAKAAVHQKYHPPAHLWRAADAVRFVWHEPWRSSPATNRCFRGEGRSLLKKHSINVIGAPNPVGDVVNLLPKVHKRVCLLLHQPHSGSPRTCFGLARKQVFHQVGQIVEASLYQVNTIKAKSYNF